MAAEISERQLITEGNQDLHAEVHEILRILLEVEAVLTRFQPLIEQFSASPLATRRALRRVRSAFPQDS